MHDLLAPANAIACLYETVTFVASIFDQKKNAYICIYRFWRADFKDCRETFSYVEIKYEF